jgi:hypothetical protein
MPRTALKGAAAGAVVFMVAHTLEVAGRIGGDQPWFIAALPSALFTAGCMFAAGAVLAAVSAGRFSDLFLLALSVAAGAAVPMAVTLFTHPRGPGNLFPFALILGGGVLLIATAAGLAAGWWLRRTRSPD